MMEYRKKNLESILLSERKSHAKHRVKRNAYSKEYDANHRVQLAAYAREWRKKNAAHYRQTRIKRWAMKKGATIGNISIIEAWETSWKSKKRVPCYWCKGLFSPSECHIDHIQPLSRGGSHSIENLAIACKECNHAKNCRVPEVWNNKLSEPVLML